MSDELENFPAGWEIVYCTGGTFLACVTGESNGSVDLEPFFPYQCQMVPSGNGLMVTRKCVPFDLLYSARKAKVRATFRMSIAQLDAPEQKQLRGLIEQAIAMATHVRAQASGIQLASVIPSAGVALGK